MVIEPIEALDLETMEVIVALDFRCSRDYRGYRGYRNDIDYR